MWRLLVRHPTKEPAYQNVPVPGSLEELRASLGLTADQSLLTTHSQHSEQQYVVETVDQVHDDAEVTIHVSRRRVYISVPPDVARKPVMWYPGATVDQIERSIAKAAGFPAGTQIELRDGEASIVLSTTIPNDTHFEVVPFVERQLQSGAAPERPSTPKMPSAASTPSVGGETIRSQGGRPQASSHSIRSANSMGVGVDSRKERSPRRNVSPGRQISAVASVGGSTTPAATQSAPEEHCLHILAGHTGFIYALCSVGDILFTGSQDNNIMIWDLNNLQYIGTLPGHRGFVKCLAASYQKKVLISGSQDRTIRVWSLDSFSTVKTLSGHTGGVNTVLLLDGIDVLVSGSEDRSIRVWDINRWEPLAALEQAHGGGVFALNCFGSPLQVVSGARDRSLKVWDSTSWQVTRTLHPPHYDGVTSIAVAGKHGKFYSGSRDRSIKEWDVHAHTNTMHSLHTHGDWVQALCMSASEDIIFSGSRDSTVKVWDGELQCQDVLQGHKGPVNALCTVGHRLFSASSDRTVRVWKIEQHG